MRVTNLGRPSYDSSVGEIKGTKKKKGKKEKTKKRPDSAPNLKTGPLLIGKGNHTSSTEPAKNGIRGMSQTQGK